MATPEKRWEILFTVTGFIVLAFGVLLRVLQWYEGPEKYDLGSPVVGFGCLLLLLAACQRFIYR